MSYTSADVETQVALILAGLDAEDEMTAVKAIIKVQAILAVLPDYGTSSTNIRYSREYIKGLIEQVHLYFRQLNKVHGGFQTVASSEQNRPGPRI